MRRPSRRNTASASSGTTCGRSRMRAPKLNHVHAAVKIPSDLSLHSQFGKILARPRENAHVHTALRLLADGANLFLLYHAQQLNLHMERQVLISSKKSVPRSAAGINSFLPLTPPVKVPRLWAKGSLSMSSDGNAPQFTGTNGPSVVDPIHE